MRILKKLVTSLFIVLLLFFFAIFIQTGITSSLVNIKVEWVQNWIYFRIPFAIYLWVSSIAPALTGFWLKETSAFFRWKHTWREIKRTEIGIALGISYVLALFIFIIPLSMGDQVQGTPFASLLSVPVMPVGIFFSEVCFLGVLLWIVNRRSKS